MSDKHRSGTIENLVSGGALEIKLLREQRDRYKAALELVAAPKRADGTYNRSREACEQIAKEALKG